MKVGQDPLPLGGRLLCVSKVQQIPLGGGALKEENWLLGFRVSYVLCLMDLVYGRSLSSRMHRRKGRKKRSMYI